MEHIEIKKPKGKKGTPVVGLILLAFLLGAVVMLYTQEEKIVEVEKVVEVKPEPPCYCTINDYTRKICSEEYKWDYLIAVATMYAESNGNPNAINVNTNDTVDFSLMQINSQWLAEFSLMELADPFKNIETANVIWERSGWAQWYATRSDRWMDILTRLENCTFEETE